MTANELREGRRARCLSQAEMGAAIGMRQQHYSPLELGKRRITKIHAAAVQLAFFVHDAGLWSEYKSR